MTHTHIYTRIQPYLHRYILTYTHTHIDIRTYTCTHMPKHFGSYLLSCSRHTNLLRTSRLKLWWPQQGVLGCERSIGCLAVKFHGLSVEKTMPGLLSERSALSARAVSEGLLRGRQFPAGLAVCLDVCKIRCI